MHIRSISTWGQSEISQWLKSKGLKKYEQNFIGVKGIVLASPDLDIEKDLKILNKLDRLEIKELILKEIEIEKKKEEKKNKREEKKKNAKIINLIVTIDDSQDTKIVEIKVNSDENLVQILSNMNGAGLVHVIY